MSDPWTQEELDWAEECLIAGDTLEEIACWSGRDLDDVKVFVGRGRRPLTDQEREILSLYSAGVRGAEISDRFVKSRGYAWWRIKCIRESGYNIAARKPRVAAAKKAKACNPRPSKDRNRTILELVQAGLTYSEIGARYRVSKSAISGVVYRAGGRP